MDIIHLLPDSVANQIAAGEVVQRPASVVKELMENAIDAGALNVSVLLEDAGRTSIQVIDDGKGMSETDARMAFERHATSKILKADDLFRLCTMGFRGEALPSIAAVSQVRLTTRTIDQELGTELNIEASRVVSQEPCACPVGANFQVRNLFYNVPARRKFLKSNQTELNNAMQEFQRVALVNPSVSFSLSNNENLLMQLPATTLRQRVDNVLGRKFGEGLIEVQVETSLIQLSGFTGRPESARKKGVHQFFFVNGRFMRHAYFHKAVQSAYEHLIPDGEQVPYVLYFKVDPSNIDVNIHPTKTEIKFENEMQIWQVVVAAIRDALGRWGAVPGIEFDTEGKPDIPVFDPSDNREVRAPQLHTTPGYNPFRTGSRRTEGVNWELLYTGAERERDIRKDSEPMPAAIPEMEMELPEGVDRTSLQQAMTEQDGRQDGTGGMLPLEGMETSETAGHHMQYRGQYVLTAVQSGLMMVDQHRAHVRILYERYLEQLEQRRAGTQGLLFPELLHLSPAEIIAMHDATDVLSALGFELSPLGGNSYSLLGVPSGLDGADPCKLIHEILNEVEEGLHSPVPDDILPAAPGITGQIATIRHRAALTMARSTAIPVGQVLSESEMETLLSDLFRCRMPAVSPTGETVLTILREDEVRKRF